MHTQLVVFDIAGTTVKDKGNVAASFLEAFAELGLELPVHDVNQVMGYRKTEAIRMLLEKHHPAELNESNIVRIHGFFEEKMLGFYMADKDLAPLPNAEHLFGQLHAKGIRVALNTGFTRFVTEGILYRLNWKESPLIDAVVCSDEVPEGRPAPYMIREIMQRFEISDPGRVVKVGDTQVDVQEGRNAGCGLVVSVTTGSSAREELEGYGPDRIIDDLSELMPYLS